MDMLERLSTRIKKLESIKDFLGNREERKKKTEELDKLYIDQKKL
jgi:hypothetical protein